MVLPYGIVVERSPFYRSFAADYLIPFILKTFTLIVSNYVVVKWALKDFQQFKGLSTFSYLNEAHWVYKLGLRINTHGIPASGAS